MADSDDYPAVTRDETMAGIAPDAAAEPRWAALSAVLAERYSCRSFRPDPVPDRVIEEIFAAAQFSPSWCNSQPWHAVVTRGEGTERLRQALLAHVGDQHASQASDIPFPQGYAGAFQHRRRACGFQLYDAVGVARGDRMGSALQGRENFRLFGAPHVAILTSEAALGPYALLDCGIFLGNLMSAMQSRGIASIAQAALAVASPMLHAHLGIPQERHILCGISFGYAQEDAPANSFRTDRAAQADVLRWQDS